MNGDVSTIQEHLGLQLLGEQALVTDLGQGHIEDLVPLGGHRFDADLQAPMGLGQLITHPVGLHHRQLTAARGDAQRGASHQMNLNPAATA